MSHSEGPSSTLIIIGILIAVPIIYSIWYNSQKCDASGGRYMKTLHNTYECIYERKN